MPTAKQMKVEVELGQEYNDYAAMTDSGDHQYYTLSGVTIWSGKSGYEPSIRPNGVVTGTNLLSAGSTADYVSIAAFTAYSKGALQEVSATNATISRPSTAANYLVNSITMASDGSIAVVSGTSSGTAFSETRATAGGPPLIPLNSVEIGQIRVSSSTSAVLTTSEIKTVDGTHVERYDNPVWSESNLGLGDAASVSAAKNAHVKFASVLPSIHTGSVPKKVYAAAYEPTFSEIQKAVDFAPSEYSHTINSQEYYRGAVASSSKSLGQGSVTVFLTDGVTDSLVRNKDEILTFRAYPDENKTPYILTQGVVGMTRQFPAANQIQAEISIIAEEPSAEFQS